MGVRTGDSKNLFIEQRPPTPTGELHHQVLRVTASPPIPSICPPRKGGIAPNLSRRRGSDGGRTGGPPGPREEVRLPKPFAPYIDTVQGLLGMSVVYKEVFIAGGDFDSRRSERTVLGFPMSTTRTWLTTPGRSQVVIVARQQVCQCHESVGFGLQVHGVKRYCGEKNLICFWLRLLASSW